MLIHKYTENRVSTEEFLSNKLFVTLKQGRGEEIESITSR